MESFYHNFSGRDVLLAGCGGGYDVFGSALVYARLKAVARSVTFLNLSFTNHETLQKGIHRNVVEAVSPIAYRVVCDTTTNAAAVPFETTSIDANDLYFPEYQLSKAANGAPVYCLRFRSKDTVEDFADTYHCLLQREGITEYANIALLLCDGGCDVLLSGNQRRGTLATFVEDMFHLRSVLRFQEKYLDGQESQVQFYIAAIGANVDCAHGVDPTDLTEHLDLLERTGVMLDHVLMTQTTPEELLDVSFYINAVMSSAPRNTIVQSLVVAGIQGHRNLHTPHHLVARIGKSKVPITSETNTFYLFDGRRVAAQVAYLGKIETTSTMEDVGEIGSKYRRSKAPTTAVPSSTTRTCCHQ